MKRITPTTDHPWLQLGRDIYDLPDLAQRVYQAVIHERDYEMDLRELMDMCARIVENGRRDLAKKAQASA